MVIHDGCGDIPGIIFHRFGIDFPKFASNYSCKYGKLWIVRSNVTMTCHETSQCAAGRFIDLLNWKGECRVKEEFMEALKKYGEKFGSERARAMQKMFDERKQKVMEDNEFVLQWLPVRKRDVTMETLLQKTYDELMVEMEKAIRAQGSQR